MKIYRVTFHTSLLVEAESESEANRIAERNLCEEVRNGSSEIYSIDHLTSADQVRRNEKRTLPWRSDERYDEPNLTVNEILGEVPTLASLKLEDPSREGW